MSTMVTKPPVLDETFVEQMEAHGKQIEEIEVKLDNITLMLAAIADNGSDSSEGSGLYFRNFKTLQQLNRMGLASKVLDSYSYIVVNKETGISVATHGTGVTAATVNEEYFVAAVGTAASREYEFIFDGSVWRLDDHVVMLSEFGITPTGTPAEGDTIVVHETASAIRYDVLDIDHDVPSDPNLEHTITLCAHDCKMYNTLPYKRTQGLIYVDPTVFPDGLAAGQLYYINCLNAAYNTTTAEDGLFGFTPTKAIPAGGLITHTQIGSYQSSASAYSKARALSGKFVTYGTIATGREIIEQDIATQEVDGTSGTLLGTVTAEDVSKRSATYCNMTRRIYGGSNNWFDSDERAWMNSLAANGADANGIRLWQSGHLGIFDIPSTVAVAGNLHGIDPQLLAVIGTVRKRTYLHAVDRTDQAVKYRDSDELVFALSMEETGLGGANDMVHENAVGYDGTVKTTPYAYYARRTTNAERIKYQNGTARGWFLRSPSPSACHTVRNCGSSGALNGNSAVSPNGAVDAYNII